eukprot:Hpha_TRINITY_DN33575_c0_g1::TRINITY_DN33575_c0_g1_i1::g.171167::m.171167
MRRFQVVFAAATAVLASAPQAYPPADPLEDDGYTHSLWLTLIAGCVALVAVSIAVCRCCCRCMILTFCNTAQPATCCCAQEDEEEVPATDLQQAVPLCLRVRVQQRQELLTLVVGRFEDHQPVWAAESGAELLAQDGKWALLWPDTPTSDESEPQGEMDPASRSSQQASTIATAAVMPPTLKCVTRGSIQLQGDFLMPQSAEWDDPDISVTAPLVEENRVRRCAPNNLETPPFSRAGYPFFLGSSWHSAPPVSAQI